MDSGEKAAGLLKNVDFWDWKFSLKNQFPWCQLTCFQHIFLVVTAWTGSCFMIGGWRPFLKIIFFKANQLGFSELIESEWHSTFHNKMPGFYSCLARLISMPSSYLYHTEKFLLWRVFILCYKTWEQIPPPPWLVRICACIVYTERRKLNSCPIIAPNYWVLARG